MQKRRMNEDCTESQFPQGSFKDRVYEAQLEHFREIIINGEITDEVVEKVVMQIHNINRYDDLHAAQLQEYEREPITIFISSVGGEVDASFAVVSAIEASTTPVTTVAIGKAMSGGFLILLAGHQRYAQRYATLMYHELSSGVGGKASDVREYSEHLDLLQQKIKEYVVDNTAISAEMLDDCHLRKADWYMDVHEAMENGCIDGVWPPHVYQLQEAEEACGGKVCDDEGAGEWRCSHPNGICDGECDGCDYYEECLEEAGN